MSVKQCTESKRFVWEDELFFLKKKGSHTNFLIYSFSWRYLEREFKLVGFVHKVTYYKHWIWKFISFFIYHGTVLLLLMPKGVCVSVCLRL